MPTARKAVAKKTTARKTTAAPEKAVEAALKVYKSRVADKVKYYQASGDLCDEEYHNIREDLDLKDFLKDERTFRLKMEFRGQLLVEGACENVEEHHEDIANALLDQLVKGVTVRCGGATMTVQFDNDSADIWESSLEDWS